VRAAVQCSLASAAADRFNAQHPPGNGVQTKSEDIMKKNLLQRAAAVLAATATTLVLFSAVAGLADDDREMLLAAKSTPTLVAGNADGTVHR
jgi:hypothetical protein